jgi:hypothetical protein
MDARTQTLFVAVAPECEHIGGSILCIYGDGQWEPYDDDRLINSTATKKVKCNTCDNVKLTKVGVAFQDVRTGELS